MDKLDIIHQVRAFNRFYMPSMHLLGNHYLGSEYSVSKARMFFEIYDHPGCSAAFLSKTMNLDKGYVSRVLMEHEKKGYLKRAPSAEDGRSYALYLTEKGKEKAEEFIRRSNEDIGGMIENLTEEELECLSKALFRIETLLRKGSIKNENRSL